MKASWLKEWFRNRLVSNPRFASDRNRKPALELQLLECRTVPATLDVSSGIMSFAAGTGIDEALSVSLTKSTYTVTDSSETISLSQAALSAGWTGNGTNTVSGPSSGITLLNLNLANGMDSFGTIEAGSDNVAVTGTGSLDVAGLVKSTGALSISGETNITDSTGVGRLQGSTITLLASNGIGAPGQNLTVSGSSPTVTANSGSAGIYLTSTAGVDITATATGAGNVSVVNTDGTLNVIPGGIDANGSAISGNISLESSGAIDLNGNIGGSKFSGTISIAGDTSGTLTSSTAAYQQNGQSLITTNTTSSAATITVNTPRSGSGAASIGEGSIGNTSGGTICVTSYGANIVWCDTTAAQAVLGTWDDCDPQTGMTGGGSNSAVLAASNYVFTATGAGSEIGTSGRPIQAADYTAQVLQTSACSTLGSAALTAGRGGIYFVDWSPGHAANYSLTLNSAIAAGGGEIRVVTAQATRHGLFVDGPVWTKSGKISLYADDDIALQGATVGGSYNGVPFSGAIEMEANRDADNGQCLSMEDNSVIATTNTGGDAIVLTDAPSTGGTDDIDLQIPTGGIDLENVSCGNGGTITVNAAAHAAAEGLESNQQGIIIQQPGSTIDSGVNGTVSLKSRAWDDSNDYLLGGIGVAGTSADPVDYPLEIIAGNIEASASGTKQPNSGSIDIQALIPAVFIVKTGPNPSSSGYRDGNDSAGIVLSDTSSAGPMTISSVSAGADTHHGGKISLTDSAGVLVSGTLGSSTSDEITVNGPLSGTGNIVLGNNKLIVNQSASSEFDGVISGAQCVTLEGGGTLLLTATHAYTPETKIHSGSTLLVNGSIASSSGVIVFEGAVLGGNGGMVGDVVVDGTLAPGKVGAAGLLNTGSLSFSVGSTFAAYLNGTTAGSGFSQVVASGAINLNNAMLNLSIGPNLNLTQPESFDILVNNSGEAVVGTFANLLEGGIGTTASGQQFQITYHGGDSGNDVVVTLLP